MQASRRLLLMWDSMYMPALRIAEMTRKAQLLLQMDNEHTHAHSGHVLRMPCALLCLGSAALKCLPSLLLLLNLALKVREWIYHRLGRWSALAPGQLCVVFCQLHSVDLPHTVLTPILHVFLE